MKEFCKKLSSLIGELKAPKNQFNAFGKYNYRSCEDILEGLKPLLDKNDFVLTISDTIVMVGDRVYVQATARVTDGENTLENTALAREPLTKKGMDDAQVTGSTSSYARKYALNGLFCIDDTRDADTQDNSSGNKPNSKPNYKAVYQEVEKIKEQLGVLCKNMNNQQKGQVMRDVLKVQAFDDLKRKTAQDLKIIHERVLLEIKRQGANN